MGTRLQLWLMAGTVTCFSNMVRGYGGHRDLRPDDSNATNRRAPSNKRTYDMQYVWQPCIQDVPETTNVVSWLPSYTVCTCVPWVGGGGSRWHNGVGHAIDLFLKFIRDTAVRPPRSSPVCCHREVDTRTQHSFA